MKPLAKRRQGFGRCGASCPGEVWLKNSCRPQANWKLFTINNATRSRRDERGEGGEEAYVTVMSRGRQPEKDARRLAGPQIQQRVCGTGNSNVSACVCECAYINTYDRNTEPERERQSGKMEMVEKKESKAESKTKAVTAI